MRSSVLRNTAMQGSALPNTRIFDIISSTSTSTASWGIGSIGHPYRGSYTWGIRLVKPASHGKRAPLFHSLETLPQAPLDNDTRGLELTVCSCVIYDNSNTLEERANTKKRAGLAELVQEAKNDSLQRRHCCIAKRLASVAESSWPACTFIVHPMVSDGFTTFEGKFYLSQVAT